MWQGIEVHQMTEEGYFAMDDRRRGDYHEMPLGSFLIFVNQPQKNNILSLFEKQVYPHRLLPNGEAEVPYDVAGWTLPLQMGVEADAVWATRDLGNFRTTLKRVENINQARAVLNLAPAAQPFAKLPNPLKTNPRVGLYKGFTGSMDEGWTRFVLDTFQIPFMSVSDKDVRENRLDFDAIILPADSENTIVKGLSADRYPPEYAGGIGEQGVENLKKYVENGGKLICFDDSCEMVIKRFDLSTKNVLSGLKRSEFYNPGSVVKLEVIPGTALAKGLPKEIGAYFSNSSAFEMPFGLKRGDEEYVATYAKKDALLSGWMLGEKYLNGQAALFETGKGKGKIVLFAFRPQHRGQSWATFPFIFNALEK